MGFNWELVWVCQALFACWSPTLFAQHHDQHLAHLRPLNVNRKEITLSGFSSGGQFAQQVYFSYSSLFSGIAVFSSTYYRCGPIPTTERGFDAVCTQLGNRRPNELYDPNNALIDIYNYYESGLIENPHNLANKPLFVYAGTRSWLFTADMSLRILQVFEPFIKNPHMIRTKVQAANLTFPSDRHGFPSCASPTNNFSVSSCGYSGAYDALRFILGNQHIRPPKSSHSSNSLRQPLVAFDQTEFFYGIRAPGRHDMDSIGFLYIPNLCHKRKAVCLLHIYFHGCRTGREFVGADHILNTGLLEVAEANNIIMLFPQVVSSVENNIGCWDTYGYTSALTATQRGPQVTVVRNMLARILGEESERSSSFSYNEGEEDYWGIPQYLMPL